MAKIYTTRLNYIQVLENTTPIFKKYFVEISLITLIIYSLTTGLSLLFPILSFLFYILVIITQVFYTYLIFQNNQDHKIVNLDKIFFSKDNFFQLLKLLKPLFFILILLIALTFAFFIPAVIFAIFWSFWIFIKIDTKLSFKQIIEYSRTLVFHNWFYIFIYLIFAFIFLNIPTEFIYLFGDDNPVFLLVGNYFSGLITSYFTIGFILIYKNLSHKKSPISRGIF